MNPLFELVAAQAVEGARERLEAAGIEFEGEPTIVTTVAWRAKSGSCFAVGSAVPDQHDHELLAASLRQSAEEAEDSFQVVTSPSPDTDEGERRG